MVPYGTDTGHPLKVPLSAGYLDPYLNGSLGPLDSPCEVKYNKWSKNFDETPHRSLVVFSPLDLDAIAI